MRQKFIYLLVVIAAVVLMSSCHTSRKGVVKLNGTNPEQARFEAVVNNSFKYDALQSKVKLSMGKTSLNGKICLEPGRRFALLANAPLLGFEIGRIEATADSVLLVDKFDKLYAVVTLADLTKVDAVAGHEMEAVECLMLGRIFIPGVGQASAKDYNRLAWTTFKNTDGSQGNSIGIFEGKNYRLGYEIDGNGRLVSTSLALANGKQAIWNYSNYTEVEKQKLLPVTEEIQAIFDEDKGIKAGFTMSNPALEESSWREFSPNSSFRRVTIQELVEVLKKMM